MDGHHAHMPPLGVYFPQTYPHQILPPQGPVDSRTHSMQSISMESLSSYSEYEDQSRSMQPQTGPQRSRRRQASGSDHVKHRRTRSGCYTCRQRRVKVCRGERTAFLNVLLTVHIANSVTRHILFVNVRIILFGENRCLANLGRLSQRQA